jgi:hypothetical protein
MMLVLFVRYWRKVDDEEEKDELVLLLLPVEEDKMAIDLCWRQNMDPYVSVFPGKWTRLDH